MRGVLFDVDDTLVDHGGAQESAIRGYLSSLGLPHDDTAVQRWRAAEDRHFHRHLTGELTFQEQRRARVRDMLGAADLDDATADAWFAGYTERFEAAWTAYDDVASALDLLASHDLAIGIVTNIDAGYQRRKLAAVGLGARDAGLRAVWLDRHGRTGGHRDHDGEPAHEVPEGIARVTSLDELDRLLA